MVRWEIDFIYIFVAGRMCFRTYFAYHCSWLTFCRNIVKRVWGILCVPHYFVK